MVLGITKEGGSRSIWIWSRFPRPVASHGVGRFEIHRRLCKQLMQRTLGLPRISLVAFGNMRICPRLNHSCRNLEKARANWRPPRPWRSRAESRLIRLITWQWLLGHGPWCSGRALARWLGVSHTYIQKLTRTRSRNESDFLREVAYSGLPTNEGLRRAREESQ